MIKLLKYFLCHKNLHFYAILYEFRCFIILFPSHHRQLVVTSVGEIQQLWTAAEETDSTAVVSLDSETVLQKTATFAADNRKQQLLQLTTENSNFCSWQQKTATFAADNRKQQLLQLTTENSNFCSWQQKTFTFILIVNHCTITKQKHNIAITTTTIKLTMLDFHEL